MKSNYGHYAEKSIKNGTQSKRWLAQRIRRQSSGAALVEFSAGFMLFIVFVIAPLISLIIIPTRLCLAQGLLDQAAQHLARSERMSIACNKFQQETNWELLLSRCGLIVKEKQISLIVRGNVQAETSVFEPSRIDDDWLPGGNKSASSYTLELSALVEVPALFPAYTISLPAITTPLRMVLKSDRQWENLSFDPETGQYFVNE